MRFHVDLPRLKAGKVGGTFWSAFVGCPANGSDFSDEAYAPGQSLYRPCSPSRIHHANGGQ